MSGIQELALKYGISIEEYKKMSREMGCESERIPQYIGSRQMTTLARDFANAGVYPEIQEVVDASDAYEQRFAQRGERSVLQKAQVDAIIFDGNCVENDYYDQQIGGTVNSYTALGKRVRHQGIGR